MNRVLGPWLAAGAAALSLSSGPLSAQESLRSEAAGCYEFEVQHSGVWPESADSLFYRPPPLVEFTLLSREVEGRHAIVVPAGSVPSPHSRAFWWTVADTLHAVWSTGFIGLRAELMMSDDGLIGEAHRFTDQASAMPATKGPFVGRRVPCDRPTRFPIASMRHRGGRSRASEGPERSVNA